MVVVGDPSLRMDTDGAGYVEHEMVQKELATVFVKTVNPILSVKGYEVPTIEVTVC